MHNRAMFSPIRSPIRSAIRSAFDRRIGQPLWLTLVQNAESAAAAAGASLWYVPPESYAARATYGPFVNSNGSGGNPTVGSGLTGWLRDAGGGPASAQIATTPYTGTTAGSWTFGADIRRNGTTTQPASLTSVAGMTTAGTYLFRFTVADFSGDGFTLAANGVSTGVGQVTGNGDKSYVIVAPSSGSPTLQFIPWNGTTGQATITNLSVVRLPGNHATQATTNNKPVLVTAPGAAASALGFAALSYVSSDLLVAPLSSSGSPGYFDMQDNGTERTSPAAATTTTVTLQVPDGRRLVVAVAATGALPSDLVTKVRALGNYIRGA